MKLICERPPIEKNPLNTKTVHALLRAGYAKTNDKLSSLQNNFAGLVFDWKRIKNDGAGVMMRIKNIGRKGFSATREWLAIVEKEYPELLEFFTPPCASVSSGENARQRNQLLPALERCVVDMAKDADDMELLEVEIYFFLQCFGTHFESDKAKEMMLHVKHTAERFMYLGFD